jgi:uncharacterized protein with FMN-binding domain
MRRAFTAVLVTVVVTVLLVNFKTRPVLKISNPSALRPVAAMPPAPAGGHATSAKKRAPARPRTIVGPVVSTRYGPVQVAATVAGRRLQDVRALILPSGDGQTNEINAQAGPLLRQEAMAAQSANIDTISGASYTSDGYRQSLQAALDRARA